MKEITTISKLWTFLFYGNWFILEHTKLGKRKPYDFDEKEHEFYRNNWEKFRDEFRKSDYFNSVKDDDIRYISLTNLEMRLQNFAPEIKNELLKVFIFKNILNSLCIKLTNANTTNNPHQN